MSNNKYTGLFFIRIVSLWGVYKYVSQAIEYAGSLNNNVDIL